MGFGISTSLETSDSTPGISQRRRIRSPSGGKEIGWGQPTLQWNCSVSTVIDRRYRSMHLLVVAVAHSHDLSGGQDLPPCVFAGRAVGRDDVRDQMQGVAKAVTLRPVSFELPDA